MTDIDQILAEIRRRDAMYPANELTPGAVADRRTLLNIIDQLQDDEQLKAARKRYRDLVAKISQVRWLIENGDAREGYGSRACQDILDVLNGPDVPISSPLRCYGKHPDDEEGNDGQHFNEDLRAAVASAIRRYPNTDAEWWIGPEAVLYEVESFLGWDQEEDVS